MADKNMVPPANLNGISRPGRGMAAVKPKNFKGTLLRLWNLTVVPQKALLFSGTISDNLRWGTAGRQ